ncbi:hypothetical protein D9M68_973280 [compost metagenome]
MECLGGFLKRLGFSNSHEGCEVQELYSMHEKTRMALICALMLGFYQWVMIFAFEASKGR